MGERMGAFSVCVVCVCLTHLGEELVDAALRLGELGVHVGVGLGFR